MSVTVVPPPGQLKETAQLLLSLADNPSDVRTVQAGNAFEVPDALGDAYNDTLTSPRPATTGKRRGARSTRATEKE